MSLHLRDANPEDAETLHRFIVELAVYEREPHEVETTPLLLGEHMQAGEFEALIAEDDELGPVGIAIFYSRYSTWKGPGVYLEDLYVTPEARGRGVGEKLLARVARITVDRGGSRLEWAVLDWNESAIGFYDKLNARAIEQWRPYRLTGEPLRRLSERDRVKPG